MKRTGQENMVTLPLPEKWMKASVVGSLWAVFEIVLGSFLHNLKIPFAGSILSFLTVFLVVAFFQIWKTDGLIWRAGIICALMKSLSPSVIILGPMLGILSEALILEIAIRLIGKNMAAYMLGGAMAVLSALAQKALSLLVLYGWNFVELLEGIVLYATRQLGIEGIQPVSLLGILSGIYLATGALASFLGFHTGKKYLKSKRDSPIQNLQLNRTSSSLFRHSKDKNHSFLMLFFLFVFMISAMIVIHYTHILFSSLYAFLFMIFGILWYKMPLHFLKRPVFWVQFVFLLVFSALFYRGFSLSGILEPEGWFVGWKMILRAQVLLTAFSGIGRELKNPLVRSILYRRGLRNLCLSLDLSFSALPGLVEAYANSTFRLKGSGKLVSAMLGSSQSLFDEFSRLEKRQPVVFLITGEVNSGKSSYAKTVVDSLKKSGWKVMGFVTLANANTEGKKTYFVEDMTTCERELLCSENLPAGSIQSGRYLFSEKGLSFGEKILKGSVKGSTDLIVIDEIGPLEMKGQGWAPVLEELIGKGMPPQLWVVRERLVDVVLRNWNIGNFRIIRAGEQAPEETVQMISEHLIKCLCGSR